MWTRGTASTYTSHMVGRSLHVALSGCFLATLTLVVWGMNKGFDITDEGYYMLLYAHPEDAHRVPYAYHLLLESLLGWVNPGPITFRVLRLLLTISATLVFSWGFWRWVRSRTNGLTTEMGGLVTVFPYLAMGSFVSYTFGPQTISYNHLNDFFLLASAGVVFYLLAGQQASHGGRAQQYAVTWGLGLLGSLHFLVKFSSAVLFLGCACAVLLWALPGRTLPQRGWATLVVVAGFCSGLVVLCLLVPGVYTWMRAFPSIYSIQASSEPHHPALALLRYGHNIVDGLWEIGKRLAVFWVLLFLLARHVCRASSTRDLVHRHVLTVAFIGLCLFFLYESYETSFRVIVPHQATPRQSLAYGAVVLSLMAIGLASQWNGMPRPRLAMRVAPDQLACVFLGILPFIGAVGTGNHVMVQLLFHLGAWFALVLLLFVKIAPHTPCVGVLTFFLWVPVLFSQVHFVQRFLLFPYRLPTNLFEQRYPLSGDTPAGGLLTDRETAELVNEINAVLGRGGFRRGDPIMALYDMSGLVYLTGGRAPGTLWFSSRRDQLSSNCRALRLADLRRSPKPVLLVSRPLFRKSVDCLREVGVHYPEGYQRRVTLTVPFWAPYAPGEYIEVVFPTESGGPACDPAERLGEAPPESIREPAARS